MTSSLACFCFVIAFIQVKDIIRFISFNVEKPIAPNRFSVKRLRLDQVKNLRKKHVYTKPVSKSF